jgi:S-methyl-5-thioribose-1-phosphate isomerase
MRVLVEGEVRELRTLWREGRIVKMIDQRRLPHRLEIALMKDHKETAKAIRKMVLRGAGAIGVAAAYGMAQAALEAERLPLPEFEAYLQEAADRIMVTRPTAVNLFHAVERCLRAASEGSVEERVRSVVEEADRIAEEDLEASKRIGEYGSELIPDGACILTHCNAGALAFIDYGTALSPIRYAHRTGKRVFVFVDETRPRCQGSRLTAWELEMEGIPYAVIADNAAGYYMRRGEIDLVIIGADRIAANGDVANKIGTYQRAVVAKENGIPFYVAAPAMTFDLRCPSGEKIEIEERSPEEVISAWGVDEKGNSTRVYIAKRGTPARNPAFDITPAEYITAFITDRGILRPPYEESIRTAFG